MYYITFHLQNASWQNTSAKQKFLQAAVVAILVFNANFVQDLFELSSLQKQSNMLHSVVQFEF